MDNGYYWFKNSTTKHKWQPCWVVDGIIHFLTGQFSDKVDSDFVKDHVTFGGKIENEPKDVLPIEYGNREGQYFTEWRFDSLRELLTMIHESFSQHPNNPRIYVREIKMWYDNIYDFHHMSFVHNAKTYNIRLYKVFSLEIDGVSEWVGGSRNEVWGFAVHIRKLLNATP